ncbi:MAG: LacI family transcriptional regulator [Actinomycetota bacterium]|nr:LacI family transcriptional regulator [Actinomycetota bacterium]
MAVTSADVARLAGVSRATVSYVLNDAPGQSIPLDTRESVRQAARELGYRPNASARSLRKGRGDAVLFPLPGLQRTHVVSLLVDDCASALSPYGLSLVTDFARYESADAQLDAWTRLHPAAVIDTLLRHDDPVLPALRGIGVPVLSSALGGDAGWESTSDAVGRASRHTQIEHLLGSGARRIAVVLPGSLPIDRRMEKDLLRGLRTHAARGGAALAVHRLDLTGDGLRGLVDSWVAGGLPDGVATYDDHLAIALLTALVSRGVRVPDDLRLIGSDDLPLAALTTPSLTTIRPDFTHYAQAIAMSVLAATRGESVPPLPVPQHRLVPRETA